MRTRGLARAPGRNSHTSPRRARPAALAFLPGRDADARLREIERQRAGLRPVLGQLAIAFLDRKAHAPLGFRCLGDWSRERLGLGARSVREWARVARALAELPRLRAAVEAGEVSWTVARKILPVVTPENEQACLATVRGRSVRAVEALVRVVQGACEEPEAGRVRVAIPCTEPESGTWAAAVELARRVAGEQLPVWACAEAIAAEAVAAVGAPESAGGSSQRERCAVPAPTESGVRALAWPHVSWRATPARAPAEPLERLARGLETVTALELDRRLRVAVACLQSLDLELGRLLRQVVERSLHRDLGFPEFERYVSERLELSPRTARRLVRIARAEQRRPEVANAFRAGEVTLLQAEALLRGSVPLERARRVTLRRLEDEVAFEPVRVVVFWAPPDVAALFVALVARFGLGTLLSHAITTWVREGGQFRDYADFERDGWRCTVPACTARRNLHSHHIRFRAAGGVDEPWNRTTLCAAHHERGVHREGSVRIWGRAPGELVFALGVGQFCSGDVKMDS